MANAAFEGIITAREEFLYPDSALGPLPGALRTTAARNGKRGIQLLLRTGGPSVSVALEGDAFDWELYRMRKIPVEYNTGDGEEQGGAMVLMEPLKEKPPYATRLAPFCVYDCLEPVGPGAVPTEDGLAALYLCVAPRPGLPAGEHAATLRVRAQEGEYACAITVKVYGVTIPEDAFPVTNWFTLEEICHWHGVEMGTEAYYGVLRKYVQAMRRIHQTMFFIQLGEECVVSKEPYTFDFEPMRRTIEIFFEEGMQIMEIGPVLRRGVPGTGKLDPYAEKFTCALAPEILFDTDEGYEVTIRYFAALRDFLAKYGWEDRAYFHLHDEPDIHIKTPEGMENRRKEYYLAKCLMYRFFPHAKVIEAVGGPAFRGGVDLWVAGTAGYEANKAAFDRLSALGDGVWAYVCCGPSGHWLNRFLDFAVLKGRLLFWGCAANRLAGFLHWGFNQFIYGMDPFKATSCHNNTGIGTNFPCGDAFIVYPGKDGPWLGMRMEAQRRGAEDIALLRLLLEKDEAAHDALVAKVFTSNSVYDDDPAHFEEVYEELLRLLEA